MAKSLILFTLLLSLNQSEAFSSYLDSLSQEKKSPPSSPKSYVDSLSSGNSVIDHFVVHGSSTTKRNQSSIPNLEQTSVDTPDDHYAKENPGAGWAGYQHPLFGGYLNNLKLNNRADGGDAGLGVQLYLGKM